MRNWPKLCFIFSLLFVFEAATAQNDKLVWLSGTIIDQQSQQPLVGATVLLPPNSGTVTDVSGNFKIRLKAGQSILTFGHLAYKSQSISITLFGDSSIQLGLTAQSADLKMINITGSKYERSILREVNQVDILKADLINNVNAAKLSDAIDKIPGITVSDGQINIRNGSGFAYGAGSRALMIVDGLPILTGDRNDIRWNFIPVEMIDQVEVVKGASSALYGAGALNGVVHVRTFWPGEKKHETRLQTYSTYYGQPRQQQQAWWGDAAPMENGLALAHGQRIGRLDIVGGFNTIKSRSYIQNSDQDQQRISLKTRFRPKRGHGLTLLLSGAYMQSSEADYIIWNDADSGAFVPLRGSRPETYDGVVRIDRRQWQVSPSVLYTTRTGDSHQLQTRWYHLEFLNFSKNLQTNIYTADYLFTKQIRNNWKLSGGLNFQQFDVDDPIGIGIHDGIIQSVFGQMNRSGARLNLELGFRYEQFAVAGLPKRNAPVLKIGANYLLRDQLALRASFGQGYRFPSFSEMFVNKPDDRLSIYPNPNLRPESGWSAELGIKKEMDIGEWRLYADLAFFMMDYQDMMAFMLGSFVPDSIPNPTFNDYVRYLGFRSENISRARIGGLEIAVTSMGKIGDIPLRILAGYTYSYPVDLNYNDTLANVGRYWGRLFGSMFAAKDSYLLRPMLKYRNRHLIKLDVESGYKKALFGIDFRYYSRIESMDTLFVAIIPGMTDYTNSRSGNEYFINLRAGYDFGKYGQLTFIVSNLTNRFYTLRFARAEPPRNFTLQYRIRL